MDETKLKPRSPLGWLFLSLLVPYAYFYWLHSSCRQICQLGRQQKTGHRIKVSPWWVTGLFSLTLVLVAAAIVVVIVGNVDIDDNDLVVAAPTVSAHESPDHGDPYESLPIDYDSLPVYQEPDSHEVDDPGDSYSTIINDDSSSLSAEILFWLLYLAALAAGLAYSIVQFFHLLQHADGLVKLAGSDSDKAFLIVMAAIGCFVTPILLVAFVYKSQSNLNQLIESAEPEPAA